MSIRYPLIIWWWSWDGRLYKVASVLYSIESIILWLLLRTKHSGHSVTHEGLEQTAHSGSHQWLHRAVPTTLLASI